MCRRSFSATNLCSSSDTGTTPAWGRIPATGWYYAGSPQGISPLGPDRLPDGWWATRFFYIAVAETKWLEDIFTKIAEYSELLWKRHGIRVGVLIRFAKWKRGCQPCRLADMYRVPLFVDNGAFSYLTASELENPTLDSAKINKWLMEYSSWARNWYSYATALALPDIPVHGREFLPAELRGHRIELTTRLHVRFARMIRRAEPAALERFIAVIQGYTVEEYMLSLASHIYHDDVLGETASFNPGRDTYGGVFGVGSVCVRKLSAKGKTALIAEGRAAGTLHDFMRDFLAAEWPDTLRGFHFFGLHTDAVRRWGSHSLYYASDTGAHGLNYRYKWRTVLGCRQLDRDCYIRAIESQLRLTLSPFLSTGLHAYMHATG